MVIFYFYSLLLNQVFGLQPCWGSILKGSSWVCILCSAANIHPLSTMVGKEAGHNVPFGIGPLFETDIVRVYEEKGRERDRDKEQ